MRDSFIFYKSFYDAIQDLDEKNQLALYNAICQKSLYNEDIELTGIADTLYKLIKPQLDANNERYENGKKGGRPKTKTIGFEKEKTTGFENKKPNKNNNVNENVNVNENNNIHFAEFVSMTNAEYEKLVSTYGKDFADQCIKVLDNYKGSSGKKYKSDYRAILTWVVKKVKDEKIENKTNYTQREYQDLNKLYSNLGGNK